ncbi:MAG: hypothetical protein MUF42_11075 [Cytophagaceae bacterium]|jgi:hypothetical protein|nr:hypothetical protein [Cytophagaceae bacterium]
MTEQELNHILAQLQEGKTLRQFFPGEHRYYFYDTHSAQYYCRKLDAVINSYNLLFRISRSELKFNLQQFSREQFQSQGFEVVPAISA